MDNVFGSLHKTYKLIVLSTNLVEYQFSIARLALTDRKTLDSEQLDNILCIRTIVMIYRKILLDLCCMKIFIMIISLF